MLFEEFKIATKATILDIGTERFGNSESPCHPDASNQVSAQSDLPFGRRCGLKNFKMATMAAILDIGTILGILNFYNTPIHPIKIKLNQTYHSVI